MPQTLYLIDGHALAYRTYFALTSGSANNRWVTRDGEPTAGVYGFASVLLRILEQENPDYLAVAFDVGKTFRDELFPDYKGTRAKMPDDLRIQIERIRQMVDAFNIPRLEMEGYEADDVLGSVARAAARDGLGVKIFTGDRDLLQLVDERILVNLPGRSLSEARDYFPDDVEDLLGIRPEQVVDYKALTGDKSDNIPGVVGIGDKTAVKLLQTYRTLEGIYEHLDELPAGNRKKLQEGRESAFLSRKLATIVTDLVVPLNLQQARPQAFDPVVIQDLFRELEFRSLMGALNNLLQRYGLQAPAPIPAGQQMSLFDAVLPTVAVASTGEDIPQNYTLVDTPESLQALLTRLQSANWIALDTETTHTDPMLADLVGISLAVDEERGFYIPVGHRADLGRQLSLKVVLEALRDPLEAAPTPKVGHNLKYDAIVLARYGLRVQPMAFDTMLAEWLCDPSSRNLGLKNLAWVRLNVQMRHIEDLLGKGKNQRTMAEVPIADAAAYAAEDARVTLMLMPLLRDELQARGSLHLFETLEMPLLPVLMAMEMEGVNLDLPFLSQMSERLQVEMTALETQIFAAAGETFNLNSPQQLSKVLFETLNLTPPDRTRRTASGFYSTSAEVLEALSEQSPVVAQILNYRELAKLRSTYVEALPQQVNPHTGKVHTSYSQTSTITGRIASSNPNLQNIPIRSEVGRLVRQAFVARPGEELLAVDYSQVELRIVAHLSGDENLCAAFRAGQDIHRATAAAIFGIPLDAVTKDQRRHAKAINFGLIYGMSAFGLTRSSDLTLAEAEDFVKAYFAQFPGVKRYLDEVRLQAAQQGYVETLLGRRRYFPLLHSGNLNQQLRNREEREAINAPVQGTAADILKMAMIKLPDALRQAGLSARMLLQVHDELVLTCPSVQMEQTARVVCEAMEGAYPLSVPLKTEARRGINWGEMQPILV
ncbi:MAG: DNA polymerase I [Anaerolineales bacterium]